MKNYLILFVGVLITHVGKAQTLVGQTLDAVPGNSTTYDGQTRPHYGIRWTTDSWFQGAPTAWISSYGGMKFFTGLNDWLSIDINGSIKAKGQSFVINSQKVGIGTETPLSALHIENNDQTYVMIKATDYTMNPSVVTKKGGIVFSQQFADKTAGISFAVPPGYHVPGIMFSTKIAWDNPGVGMTEWYDRMFIHPDGNVGIGTTTPGEKLAVNGRILAKEIKVISGATTSWPDYVFKPTYQLTPLRELEQFIKTHQHLPEIPSAREVAANGIEVGANQALLLKKIEELTLHIIDVNKNVESLNSKVARLEKENEKLRIKLNER